MKKTNLFILLAIFCSAVFHANAQGKYTFSGTLIGPEAKAFRKPLYLTYTDEWENHIKLDSAKVKNSKFTFKGNIPAEVRKVYLEGLPGGKVPFFLDPAPLTTTVNMQSPELSLVMGSHSNELYNKVKELLQKTQTEIPNQVETYVSQLPNNIKQDKNQLKIYTDAETARLKMLGKLTILDFISSHFTDPISPWLVEEFAAPFFSDYTMMRAVLKAIPIQYRQTSVYTNMLSNALSSEMKQGTEAPIVTGKDLQGNRISSADMKGKYLLLTFWTSDNQASINEMTLLKQAMQAAAQFGRFNVLCYSLDTDFNTWKNAVERNGLQQNNWFHASTLQGKDSQAAAYYHITNLPHTILISPDGRIISLELKSNDIVKKVTRIAEGIESYENK